MTRTSTARLDVDYEDMKTGFQSGRAAALSDWSFRKEQKEFATVVNRLRVKKWAKENPEKRRRNANRYASKPAVKARQRAWQIRRRHGALKARATVYVCVEPDCRAEWCRVPGTYRGGPTPRYCSSACSQRNRYQRKHPGAKRIKRKSAWRAAGERRAA